MSFIKNANFISADPEWKERAPKFKKSFSLSGKVNRAELQISALGVYLAYINGVRVGDFVLAPGWTEYEKRLQYQRYDVTELLSDENDITVGVGHGWYASNVGFSAKYPLGEYPMLIAALRVYYTDGRCETVYTDDSWLCAKSKVLSSTIYGGEVYDARIEEIFSENARICDADKGILIETEGEVVREIERISARSIIKTPEGDTVIDFGQNLTGYPELRLFGEGGERIVISCAEILDKYGNFYNENYRSARSEIDYTLASGENLYKPHYTFFGFRYLKIEGNAKFDASSITAVVVHSDINRTGYFKSGHAKLNKLFENIIWGQRGNFLDVPTDCPQRDERLGWTGDAQVFCRTAMLNYDCEKFFYKWIRDLAASQYPDGGVPRVVPNAILEDPNSSVEDWGRRHSAAWGDAATVCPYEYYMAYGNKDFLKSMLPTMKKWVGYIEKYAPGYIWSIGFHYGDWLALDRPEDCKGGTDHSLIATAFFYYSTTLTAKAARICGEDASYYEELLPKIKAAFREKFVVDGRMSCDTQTAAVVAIHHGLLTPSEEKTVGQRLIELIEERGDTLSTGFVGTPYLLDTLTKIGRIDKAYTLLLQEKFPSWFYSINCGATTIWEHWDGINENGDIWRASMNSFNHYAYGAVAAWLYRTVAGIKYDEEKPAYEHFTVEPRPIERLGSASAQVTSKFGKISSEWVYEADGRIRYTVEVPHGTSAKLIIDGISEELTSGRYTRYSK